jgi:exonuclease SbcC
MKLTRLELFPFAGFVKKELAFAPGLNVVLGENDKGKSTVFRAIDAALFLPIKISKSTKEGRDLLPRVLPLGGDHARVKISLENKGEAFELEKTWGQGAAISLERKGTRLAAEDKVEEQLRAFLPVPAATFQSVLFMGQGALPGTVALLAERRDALHSLGDLLRLTLDKTAGVSVARLKEKLTAQIAETFEHWDRLAALPENGKGIDNPWKKGIGRVLTAYYKREELKRASQSARQLATERDARSGELAEKMARRDLARAFVAENRKFVESSDERRALEASVARARAEASAMLKDYEAWARAELTSETNAPEVLRLEASRIALDAELKQALAAGKTRDAAARLEKARAASRNLQEAKAKLSLLPALTAEALRRLRAAQAEVDGLRVGLKSGKIQLSFEVKEELEVTMRKDLEAERTGTMTSAKPLVLNAGGRIQLQSRHFSLTVTSGEGSIAQLEEQLASKNEHLARILAELKAESLEQAQAMQEKYSEVALEARSAEAVLTSVLGTGVKLGDLERLAAASPESAGREPALVQGELSAKIAELVPKREAIVRAEAQLQDLARRYGVKVAGELMEKAVEKKSELGATEKKLTELPALPPGSEDLAERYARSNAELARLGEEIGALQVAVAELKVKMPEQSAEDLERAQREADAEFQGELTRGRALLRVEDAVKGLDTAGSDLFGGFRAEFEKQASGLSKGKYLGAQMSEALPSAFARSDGAVVPYEWLSSGTKDAFALALRLAMASHFLGAESGFLMIDDPLVNMDPERQKIAAGMLREFAARRQVVVFTCHPHHAALLGGNQIEL